MVAVCLLLVGGAAGWAAGATALPCAEWISTGAGDTAGVGHLIGTKTVKRSWDVTLAGITYHIEEQFEVGTYEFDGGTVLVNCSNYTLYR
jgi:hypothetical protein